MVDQLKIVLGLVRRPLAAWAAFSSAGSLVLGVAAMLPLMQIEETGSPLASGSAGIAVAAIGSSALRMFILGVAGFVACAVVFKSLLMIVFRWWQLGFITELQAEASTEFVRRYVRAPYWAHRTREFAEVRLSTVRHADKVGFLSEGSVKAEGSFAEVQVQVQVQVQSPGFSRVVSLGQL